MDNQEDYKKVWNGFRKKYKNCWLMCDKDSDVGNGNLSWLMDKFKKEEENNG